MSEFASELTNLVRSMAQSGDEGVDRWPELRDLGLVGIGTAEESGGSGGTFADLLVVVRELGSACIESPIVEASTALYATGEEAGFGVPAFTENDLQSPTITGDFVSVPYAGAADRLLLVGRDRVATVSLNDERVRVTAGSDLAGTASAHVHLDSAAVDLIDRGPGAAAVTSRLALARSAQLLGLATGAYLLTRTYVSDRRQFGAPLTAIPAVTTALAQMTVRLRSVQSALDRAVVALDEEDNVDRYVAAAAGARVLAAQSATQTARIAHQLHGAVGITLEYGLHRHTRRLWAFRDADRCEGAWSRMLGESARHADETVLWSELTA